MSEQDKYTDPGLGWLDQALENYSRSDIYPFHMPGHKRRKIEQIDRNSTETGNVKNDEVKTRDDQRYDTQTKCENADIIDIDITEIDGFDNLHHPEGILKAAQQRMARLCGADQSFFLVNGSTAGLLAAISAAVPRGGKILIARNCHKAVYHACFLRQLQVSYLYPAFTEFGIQGSILPTQVGEALAENPGIQAVLITSPTYDGVVSDIQSISNIVHAHGIPLIVDEAHGAHFPFSEQFPKDSVSCGADVVIHSVHKTLPSLTQTALIHLNGDLINREKIRYFLGVYQSSSPSYVMMAGIDQCMEWVFSHRKEFDSFAQRLQEVRAELRKLQALELLEVPGIDPSKILLSGRRYGVTGNELSDMLREDFHIELEMACGEYACALTSVADRQEDLRRLLEACRKLDEKILRERNQVPEKQYGTDTVLKTRHAGTIQETFEQPSFWCDLKASDGKVSSGFVIPYPPGIPLLVPGEEVTEEIRDRILRYVQDGLTVYGCENQKIKVVGKQETWEKYFV